MGKMPWESSDSAVEPLSTAENEENAGETQPRQEAKSGKEASSFRNRNRLLQFLWRFNLGNLGCLIIVLLLGMFIAFFAQDFVIGRFFGGDNSQKAVPTSATEPETCTLAIPSLVLVGTAFDGNVCYFDSPDEISCLDAATGNSETIAKFVDYKAFHWSPQRKQIALVIQDRTDTLPRLYVANLVSPPSDEKPVLITHRDENGFPAEFGLRANSPVAWSQDEQYIAFAAYDQDERAALFVTDVSTGAVRRLTEGSQPVTSVAWETYTNAQDLADERIVYVLLRDGKEFTYSVEKNGAENNTWER